MDICHWVVQVVLRPKEQKGFVLLPKRWVVERTFGWLSWCRRLNRDHEGLPETSETWIYVGLADKSQNPDTERDINNKKLVKFNEIG